MVKNRARLLSVIIFFAVCAFVFDGCATGKIGESAAVENETDDVSIDSIAGGSEATDGAGGEATGASGDSRDNRGVSIDRNVLSRDDSGDATADGTVMDDDVTINNNAEIGGNATSGVAIDRNDGAVANAEPTSQNNSDVSTDRITADGMGDDTTVSIDNNARTSNAQSDVAEPEENAEDEPLIVGRGYRDAQGRLRAFSYGTERLAISGDVSGSALVNFSDGRAVRRRYDDAMRLVKIEVWRIGESAAESARESEQTFQYNGNETSPASSVAEGAGWRIETRYDEKGRVLAENVFFIIDDNKIPDTETARVYDGDGRIVEENYTRFDYGDEQKSRLAGTFTRRDVYEYVTENPEPNRERYEDGALRLKTVWRDGDNYTETTYFDGGYAIVSEYSQGRKTRETVMREGVAQRTRTYEN